MKWRETVPGVWTSLSRGKPGEAKWRGTGYRVTRKVVVCDDHVGIADTFTNTTSQLVGVMHENGLVLPDQPLEVKQGGRAGLRSQRPGGQGAFRAAPIGLRALRPSIARLPDARPPPCHSRLPPTASSGRSRRSGRG